MIRTAFALRLAVCPLAATFAAALAIATFSPAHADQSLPPIAQTVRTTIIALSAADAVTPLATAYLAANEVSAVLPAALKPDTANAMASVRTASARRAEPAYSDRRVTYRPSRDPFFLATGIAY